MDCAYLGLKQVSKRDPHDPQLFYVPHTFWTVRHQRDSAFEFCSMYFLLESLFLGYLVQATGTNASPSNSASSVVDIINHLEPHAAEKLICLAYDSTPNPSFVPLSFFSFPLVDSLHNCPSLTFATTLCKASWIALVSNSYSSSYFYEIRLLASVALRGCFVSKSRK